MVIAHTHTQGNTPKIVVRCAIRITSWPDGIWKCVCKSGGQSSWFLELSLDVFTSFYLSARLFCLFVFSARVCAKATLQVGCCCFNIYYFLNGNFESEKRKKKKRGGKETEAQQQHAGRDFTNHFRPSIFTCDDNPYRRNPFFRTFHVWYLLYSSPYIQ